MKATSLNYYFGYIAVLFAAFFWGTAGTASAFSTELSPIVLGTISAGLGGLIHFFLNIKKIQKNFKNLLEIKKYLFIGVVASICCPLFFYCSISFSGVAIGTVVSIGCAPIFSMILEILFENSKINYKWLLSFILSFIGVVILSFSKNTIDYASSNTYQILGIIFGLLSSLGYATYSIVMRQIIIKGIDSRAAMGCIFGICAFLMIPTLLITGKNILIYPENIWVALYIPIFPMFIGYFLFSYALKKIPASQALNLALVEIPVATLLAVLLLNEKMSHINYIGIASILLGVFVLMKK